jgi:hypothetical protein
MMPEEQKKSNTALISGAVVLVLAVAGYGVFKYTNTAPAENVNTPAVTAPLIPPVVTPTASANVYKDGTYASDGMYVSPGGDEKINVSLVLKDDVVLDATVKVLATLPISKTMQTNFAGGFKALVVGKKLSEVNLTKVSGSSLTPKGWNDAVAKIQVQAKA